MSTEAGVRLVVRSEIRRRARGLTGLALVVALASGVVLTTLAGARRTETSFDRFRAESQASDAWVQVGDADRAAEVVAQLHTLPMVTDAVGWVVTPAAPVDAPTDTADFALMGDPNGRYAVDVDRPRLLSGRLPNPEAADEVLLSATAADAFGRTTGDHLVVQTFSPDDIESIASGGEFLGMNGPELDLTVVGVGRWPEELGGRVTSSVLAGLVTPTFVATHASSVGSWPASGRVRLTGGTSSLEPFTTAARDLAGPDVEVIVEGADAGHVAAIQAAIDALAVALLALGAICTVVGLVIVGQATSRHLALSTGTARTLGALGLSVGERTRALLGPVALALGAGLVVGAAGSVLASPLLPVGLARDAEPSPGVSVDAVALGTGSLVLLVAFGLWALVAARRVVRAASDDRASRARPSWVAQRVARAGGRPSLTTGVRFAFEAGAGRTSIPVRTAIAGGVLGVAGVVAVAVVAVSLTTLAGTPARWGWTWSSRPDIYGEVEPALEQLVADERIDAAAGLTYAAVEIGNEQMEGYAVESIKGSIPLTYLDGRAPTGLDEIAVGERTLHALDASLGDSISIPTSGRAGTATMEIVGVVATPLVESTDPGRGAVLSVEGLERVAQSDGSRQLLLRYDDGVDAAALETELADSIGLSFPIYARPDPPGAVANLQQVQGVTVVLAAFFALLGTVGVAHALAVSVRRRRQDLGVLQVLGFERSQVRGAIGWQAVAIAMTSLAIGIPSGLVIGRIVWRALTNDLGVLAEPAQPWLVLLAIIPFSLVIGLLVAALPARRAGRLTPALALRSE